MHNDSTNLIEIPLEEKYKINRHKRYNRQKKSALYALETHHSVKTCMRSMMGSLVGIKVSRETGRAYYGGLVTCGSVWDCPVCAAKISASRNEEIKQAKNIWLDRGGLIVMVTYTIQHDRSDKLKDLHKVLTDSMRFVKSGAPWKRIQERYKIAGSITATEVLYNNKNGWHIHKHQLLFIDHFTVNTKSLQDWIYARYEKSLESSGYYSRDGIGIKISEPETIEGNIDQYLTKWGLEDELTATDKDDSNGMTPFQLLDDDKYRSQFIEYSKAMYGKRRLTWSRGLRDLLDLGEEKPDDAIAQEEDLKDIDTIRFFDINHNEWRYILKNDLRLKVLEKAEVTEWATFNVWYFHNVLLPARDFKKYRDK